MSKKNILEIFVIALAALVFGLGRNYFSQTPLPLFKAFEKTTKAEKQIQFTEADVDFVRQVNAGQGTVLLDARLPELFNLGHIPGAISLPLARFDDAFAALQGRLQGARLLVVYCSGPNCNDSYELALRLWGKGFKDLLLYRGGVDDWLEKGNALVR